MEWILKTSYIASLQGAQPTQEYRKAISKRMEKDMLWKYLPKQTLRQESVSRDKEGHCMMIKCSEKDN